MVARGPLGILYTQLPLSFLKMRTCIALLWFKYVVSLKIKTSAQLEAAIEHLGVTDPNEFDLAVFVKACGVEVVVSTEEIEVAVNEILDSRKNEILEQRYRINVGELLRNVREKLRWADPKLIKKQSFMNCWVTKLQQIMRSQKRKRETRKIRGKESAAEVAPLKPSEE